MTSLISSSRADPAPSSLGSSRAPQGVARDPRVHLIASPVVDESPQLDIIAVHGERGHWERSWTAPNGCFWLRDVLPGIFPSVRIIACTQNSMAEENPKEGLLWDLIDDRAANGRENVPILFIAHSIGGLVAKSLFNASAPSRSSFTETHQFHRSIRGFMFFGTLHHGEYPAFLDRMYRILALTPIPGKNIMSRMSQVMSQPQSINDDFLVLGGSQVPTVCFYELRSTPVINSRIVSKDQATLSSAENRALDLHHAELCKFFGPDDGQLGRVLGSLRRLVEKAANFSGIVLAPRIVSKDSPSGLKVLALDGGGVRGLFSIVVLEHLMEAIRRIDLPDSLDVPKPCNYFDLICGTSTGGILAIMLSRLRMDVRECKQVYQDISGQIFAKKVWSFPGKQWWDAYWDKPWFAGENLEAAVKRTLEQKLSLHETSQLSSSGISKMEAPLIPVEGIGSRCFVCALPEGQRTCEHLRSYTSGDSDDARHIRIWEACRATSAAPLYFPPIVINGRKYFDGGMHSNNPILELVREATQEYPDQSFDAIVSIGTGLSQIQNPGGGIANFIYSMISRATDTELRHEEFLRDFPNLRQVYWRFQEADRLGNIDLSASTEMAAIEGIANDYLKLPALQVEMERCARSIAKNRHGADEAP